MAKADCRSVVSRARTHLLAQHRNSLFDLHATFAGLHCMLPEGESEERLAKIALHRHDAAISELDSFEMLDREVFRG